MIERAIKEIDFPPLKVLILDEAQDCTPLQWSVIYKMANKVKRIYLAGDDDQAIYIKLSSANLLSDVLITLVCSAKSIVQSFGSNTSSGKYLRQ